MNRNYKLDIVKSILIFTVIIAHTLSSNIRLYRIYQLIGIVGVPCFFFISGFLDKVANRTILKKVSYILPWILLGSFTYIINSVAGDESTGLELNSWIKYLVGYRSHLYYLTMLLVFQLSSSLFEKIKFLRVFESYAWCITLVCALYIDIKGINNLIIYPYLNPVFWFGYWSLGKLYAGKLNVIPPELLLISKSVPIIIITATILWCFGKGFITYFSTFSVLFNFSLIYLMSCYVFNSKYNFSFKFGILGKSTLFIYLSHNIVIGYLNTLNRGNIIWDICKPFIVLLIYWIMLAYIKKYLWNISWIRVLGRKLGIKL